MRKSWALALLFLVFVSCGKNDGVTSTGNYRYAPAPRTGAGAPAGVPQIPSGWGPGSCSGSCFSQQQGPASFSGQPYSFWFVLQAMNRNYMSQQDMQYTLYAWSDYCSQNNARYDDIGTFMNFTGYYWQNTPYSRLHDYLNYYGLYWAQPGMQYNTSYQSDFWSSYEGFPYNYCTSCYYQ